MDDENSEEENQSSNACENENRTGQVDFDIVLRKAQRCEMGIPLSFFSETCACQSNRRKSFMRPISVQRILGIRLSVNLFSGVIINLVRNSSV